MNISYDTGDFSERLLDFYKEGEYAYEEGTTKTEKQKQMKFRLRKELDEGLEGKKLLKEALTAGLNGLQEPIKLREENKQMRSKILRLEEWCDGVKSCGEAKFKDEIRKEVRAETKKACEERMTALENNARKYKTKLEHLYNNQQEVKDRIPRAEHERVVKANDELFDMINTKYKKSKKQIKTLKCEIEYLKKKKKAKKKYTPPPSSSSDSDIEMDIETCSDSE
jgi:DNA repair ATPase RecN